MRYIGWMLAGMLASFGAAAAEVTTATTTAAPVARGGQRAVLDPVTKRPTAPKTADQKSRQAFGVQRPNRALMWVESRTNGVKVLHTEGQARMASFARISTDGKAEYHCIPGSLEHAAHAHDYPHNDTE